MLININHHLNHVESNRSISSNLDWLTYIRGVAAIYVVFHHAVRQVIVTGDFANDRFYRFIELLTSFGHYAVDIFIVLSGYCLMLPILKKNEFGSVSLFLIRRFIRIAIPYYFAIAFSLFLIYFWLGAIDSSHWAVTSLPVTMENIILHVFFIHQIFPTAATKINPAHWSVGVEFNIYILFPILYWCGKKYGYLKITTLITVTTYTFWYITYSLNILNPGPNGTSIYYLSLFMMGATAAAYNSASSIRENYIWENIIGKNINILQQLSYATIICTALLSVLIPRFSNSYSFPLQIQSLFIGCSTATLLFLRGRSTNRKSIPGLIDKFFVKAGIMGFSIYLIHDPIVALTWKYFITPINIPYYWLQALLELAISMIFTIILSMVFFQFIENPLHRISKGFSLSVFKK